MVLQAQPGAGKSTVVPLALLNADYLVNKKIIMLEPRRMAARNLAYYMAQCIGEQVGQTIGYQVKGDAKLSKHTRLEIVTEGILLNRLQKDAELSQSHLIIFDEFHERSINADLALLLCYEIQQYLRDDLRLLVMSATLDTELVSDYLAQAPVILCEGRSYPVSTYYQDVKPQQLVNGVISALDTVMSDEGDVLVFLPGIADIRRCLTSAKQRFANDNNIEFLALYGALSLAEQQAVIANHKVENKRVIFSTNIAETSLTIQGVRAVIDSGTEKTLIFNPASGMSSLTTQKISKASATQRQGRAGRVAEGKCIRLWSKASHYQRDDFQQQEILNADLAQMVLILASHGHISYQSIPWLTAPPKAHFQAAQALLQQLTLLDENNKITSLGRLASQIPCHPRLAYMLLSAKLPDEKMLAGYLAALLNENNRSTSADNVDLSRELLIKIHAKTQDSAHRNFLREVTKFHGFISEQSIKHQHTVLKDADISALAAVLLLKAYPERLAQQRSSADHKYLLANGKGVSLHRQDPLNKHQYLVVNDCDADNRQGRIYSAIAFDITLLRQYFADRLKEQRRYQLHANKSKVIAKTQICYGHIVIAERQDEQVPKQYLQQCLLELLKTDAKQCLNWTTDCEYWLDRVAWLGQQLVDFPKIDFDYLSDNAEDWLLPYLGDFNSLAAVKKVNILPLMSGLLSYQQAQQLEKHAPQYYVTPSNKKITIQYSDEQNPTVSVVLQELFGELSSPMLANNTVPLRFELLSPAKRPIQITSDLARFWHGTYHEVAKDMRAKYPKHRWPEYPLQEKAGRSIKSKK